MDAFAEYDPVNPYLALPSRAADLKRALSLALYRDVYQHVVRVRVKTQKKKNHITTQLCIRRDFIGHNTILRVSVVKKR